MRQNYSTRFNLLIKLFKTWKKDNNKSQLLTSHLLHPTTKHQSTLLLHANWLDTDPKMNSVWKKKKKTGPNIYSLNLGLLLSLIKISALKHKLGRETRDHGRVENKTWSGHNILCFSSFFFFFGWVDDEHPPFLLAQNSYILFLPQETTYDLNNKYELIIFGGK